MKSTTRPTIGRIVQLGCQTRPPEWCVLLENNTHDAVITKPKVQQKLGHQVLKRNSSTNGLREPSEVETTLEMDEEEPTSDP